MGHFSKKKKPFMFGWAGVVYGRVPGPLLGRKKTEEVQRKVDRWSRCLLWSIPDGPKSINPARRATESYTLMNKHRESTTRSFMVQLCFTYVCIGHGVGPPSASKTGKCLIECLSGSSDLTYSLWSAGAVIDSRAWGHLFQAWVL